MSFNVALLRILTCRSNGGGLISISTGPFTTAALISETDGAYLVQQFIAGNNITVTFPQEAAHEVPNPTGGLMSDYSTYGPNYGKLLSDI